jgi:hypothetical protein
LIFLKEVKRKGKRKRVENSFSIKPTILLFYNKWRQPFMGPRVLSKINSLALSVSACRDGPAV